MNKNVAPTQTYDFSHPRLWNPVYIPLLTAEDEYIHLFGGAGSGKSRFAAQKEVVKSFESERAGRKTLVIRKVGKTLKDSVYAELKGVIHDWGLHGSFSFLRSPLSITNLVTNVEFLFTGLDDIEKVKSISGVDRIWAEEASELTVRNELDQLRLRLRGYDKIQITLSYNPISSAHWINTEIHEQAEAGNRLLRTTYRDNVRLLEADPSYAESIEKLKLTNPNYYKIYGLGEWGGLLNGLIYPAYHTVTEMPEVQFYGLDWGWNDELALVAGTVEDTFGAEKKDYTVQELIYERHLSSGDLITRMDALGVSKYKPIVCDNSRPEMINDLVKAGYRARPCTKYAGSVVDGISTVKNYSLNLVAGGKNLFKEVQNYQWASGKDGQLNDVPIDALNHCMDALRYGLESQKIQQWTVKKRQSR